MLDQARVRYEVEVKQPRTLWADEDADDEVCQAGRQGQTVDDRARDRHEEQEGADEQEVDVRFRQDVPSVCR